MWLCLVDWRPLDPRVISAEAQVCSLPPWPAVSLTGALLSPQELAAGVEKNLFSQEALFTSLVLVRSALGD